MTRHTLRRILRRPVPTATLWACIASIVAGCAAPPPPSPPPEPPKPTVVVPPPEPPPPPPPPPPAEPEPPKNISRANNLEEYRYDVAVHLYAQNQARVFKGKMPPLLYAVGVLETDIDARGEVTDVRWLRAPSHAPEVMTEIEHMVRQASPYPAPARLGKITYTETWLWHKSGHFQLHTLSEGQM